MDSQLIKGILEGCILSLLKQEKSYGYQVVEKLREKGFDNTQEATVYPILTRLQKKGLLSFEKEPSDLGPPRKYYGLTQEGNAALLDFSKSWQEMKNIVDNILKKEMK